MPKSYYFAGWLIDGTGTPAKRNVLICVENGLISSLERANSAELPRPFLKSGRGDLFYPPFSREAQDGFPGFAFEAYPACTILPGLTDCHVHLTMSGKIDQKLRFRQLLYEFAQNSPLICERIERSLTFGIMALRDGGDVGGHALMYIRQNGHSRVHVKCAGKGWRAPGRYGKIIGRVPENGSTLAESIKANCGAVDHVKIINSGINSLAEFGRESRPQFNRDELGAAFRNARDLGRKVMVHANGRLPVQFAVEAGCDSIEHGFFMGEDNLKRMADRQVFWVPTAFTMKALHAHMPAGSDQSEAASRMLEAQLEQMGRARELGVTIAAGTDAGSLGVRHGAALTEELKLMVEAGFPVEEVIGCATSGGARLLGLEHELGRLCRGMPANFIVVGGPPSGLPDSLGEVKMVCVRGKKV